MTPPPDTLPGTPACSRQSVTGQSWSNRHVNSITTRSPCLSLVLIVWPMRVDHCAQCRALFAQAFGRGPRKCCRGPTRGQRTAVMKWIRWTRRGARESPDAFTPIVAAGEASLRPRSPERSIPKMSAAEPQSRGASVAPAGRAPTPHRSTRRPPARARAAPGCRAWGLSACGGPPAPW